MSSRCSLAHLHAVRTPSPEPFDPPWPGSYLRRWWRALALGLLLGAVAAALLPAPGRADFLDDAWGRFERSLATFDPVGRHLLAPIERRVPALTLNGTYYLWADVLVTKTRSVGYRNKDFRALQFQNLLELELRYRIGESVELTSINHVLYDGVYDIQDSTGLFADRVDEDFRYYHDFERIVRELYVSYRTPKLDVVIGKQQIVWGKMDGRFIDVINAIDARESVQLEASDYEVRRLPAWMVNRDLFLWRQLAEFPLDPGFRERSSVRNTDRRGSLRSSRRRTPSPSRIPPFSTNGRPRRVTSSCPPRSPIGTTSAITNSPSAWMCRRGASPGGSSTTTRGTDRPMTSSSADG